MSVLKVSHSKLRVFKRCHKQYNYRYVQKLRKKIKNKNLYMGSIVHEALEAHFLNQDVQAIYDEYQKEYNKLFEEERVELEGIVELSEKVVNNYIEHYKDDPLEVLEVEKLINVELCEGVILEGKVDLIASDKKGRVFIQEHKTCKSLPDEATRMSDVQTVIYNWALQKEGYKIHGVIWDYLRKKAPVVPEPLKKGGLSKNMSIDTTYSTYLQAIKDNGYDPKDYSDILERLKNKANTFFDRVKLPFNQALVNTVVEDAITTSKIIQHLGTTLQDRNLTRDCSWCDYYNLCQTELRGIDSDYLKKKEFTVSERKDGNKKQEKTHSKNRRKTRKHT